jgi:hypothetical protein
MARFEKKIQKGASNAMTAFRFVLVIAFGGLDGKAPAEFSSGALGSTSACAARFLPDYASARKGIHTARPL